MPIQASINFVKDRLVSGLSLTKPALDLLAERLDEAARFNAVGGNPSLEKSKERVSMPALIHRHGRIETAMMCMVVENVASAFLVHDHGVRGAIDRTLPLLSTRAMSTFDTAYDFLIGQAHTLVDAAAKSLDERVSPSLKAPAGVVVAGVDRSLRIALGEDYVVSARAYVAAVPERASTFARVKAAKVMAIKDNSRLASFLVSGVVHSSALSIFGAASFFAFTHVLTIRVEEEEEDMEGARRLALLACDLSTTTTATSTTAEDADISDDNTLDFLLEDVVQDGKVEEVAEEVEAVEDGEEEAVEDVDVEDVEEEWVEEGLEAMDTDTGVDDDDEITIIPSWLIEEVVVEEIAHVAGVDAEGYADEEEDDIFDFEPTLSVIEEVDEEDEVEGEGVEDVDVKATLSVAEWLDDVEDVEGGFDDDVVGEEDFGAVCGVEDDGLVSEHAALEMFDDEMLLELAIMEQYQGRGEEDGEEDGLVSVAVLRTLEEEEELSAELLLELAIMEQYQQDKQEELVKLEEHPVEEEIQAELEEDQEGGVVQVVEEAEGVVAEGQNWADEVETFLLSVDGVVEVESALSFKHGDETDVVADVAPKDPKGGYATGYNELRWATESMAAYALGPIVEEDLPEVKEAVVLSGPTHQLARCASMPLSLWRSATEGPSLVRSASFELRARRSHFEDVEDVLEVEPAADVALLENKEEVCESKEESVEETRLVQPSVAVNLVQEIADVRSTEENMPSILTSGSSSSRSTLTALASPFVPRGNLKLSAPVLTSAPEDSEKENGFGFQVPPPAHWTPAKGVSVTISAPRPTPPPVKAKKGPSRKERHIARMGIKKGKGKGKEKDQSNVLSERDLNTK